MRLRLLSLCSVLVVSIVACGGSDSSREPVKPQIGSVNLVATREGDATVLSSGGPVSPEVVIPDDALPDGLSSTDLTGSVIYASDPITGVTAVEFNMGPDGTEFSAPIELTWLGRASGNVTTAIMAVNDKGENLLSQDEAAAIIENMKSSVTTEDGGGKVSLSVNHFSKWAIFQVDEAIAASTFDMNRFFEAEVKLSLDYWRKDAYRPQGIFMFDVQYLGTYNDRTIEPCVDPRITITGDVKYSVREGASCGSDTYDSRSLYINCPDLDTSGTITVDFTAYFGVPGFAPLEKFAMLITAEQRKVEKISGNETAYVASTDLAVFINGRLTKSYNCADGAGGIAATTAPASTAVTLTTTPVSSILTALPTTVPATTKPNGGTTLAPNGTTVAPTGTTLAPTGTTIAPTTTAARTTVPASSSTTWDPYSSVPTTPAPATTAGAWIRNDSLCRWHGMSTCGVYGSGNSMYEEVGPAGGPGQTYTPIGGSPGDLAYNLLAGNSIDNCDYNGSGGCGYYYTGTAGSYRLGPLG